MFNTLPFKFKILTSENVLLENTEKLTSNTKNYIASMAVKENELGFEVNFVRDKGFLWDTYCWGRPLSQFDRGIRAGSHVLCD